MSHVDDNLLIDTIKAVDLREFMSTEIGPPLTKRRDAWNWACPFVPERTPGGAFWVYRDHYYCYSCHEHGDILDWTMEMQSIPFGEAVDRLASRMGLLNATEANLIKATQVAKQAQAELEQTIKEAEAALTEIRQQKPWEQYHRNLDKESRVLWNKRGIPDSLVDYWMLGYRPDFPVYTKQDGQFTLHNVPTLAFPVWGHDWQVMNVKHRLLQIPDGFRGKYLPETSGIHAAPFIADPETNCGKLVLVEGEIKAMVVYSKLDSNRFQVSGLPGSTPDLTQIHVFDNYEAIYLCLDPDAYYPKRPGDLSPVEKLAEALGRGRVVIFRLPVKIDDAMNAGYIGERGLFKLMRMGRVG